MTKQLMTFTNRDISWLSFNERVLQEAANETVPLLERLRFLGIYSSNRDEFFRVRIATLQRTLKLGIKGHKIMGEPPQQLLERLEQIMLTQQQNFNKIYKELIATLASHKIVLIDEKKLDAKQDLFVRNYFHETVYPRLVPIMLSGLNKFPYLRDKSIYFFINLVGLSATEKPNYALVEIPSSVVPRFLIIPGNESHSSLIFLDDVIRHCLKDIFSIFKFKRIEAFSFKITRDAELDFETDVSKSLVEKISRSIKKRKTGEPVRLAYDVAMPKEMLVYLKRHLKGAKQYSLMPEGRYLNMKDLLTFPSEIGERLRYQKLRPTQHPALNNSNSKLRAIELQDVLLCYPYQSYNHILDILREASIAPSVKSIKITLYRVAPVSSIVHTLINAVKNGKQVTAVVELQARFDEEANIYWANKLKEEGANVIYGVPGLKVHSKLFIITAKEKGKTILYSHIGTGNFNEDTAKVYVDHALLTSNKTIGQEVNLLFDFYQNNFKTGKYEKLLVAPFSMRTNLLQFIKKETKHALSGKKAHIILKMNSLSDPEMMQALSKASASGVKVQLIIRGICCLGSEKASRSNISSISIVDKYLEHSRIFYFFNDGKPRYYLSSADLMGRNLDFRSEVAVPIEDDAIRKQLMDYLHYQLRDNVKARLLNGSNEFVPPLPLSKRFRSQDELYLYFKQRERIKK